MVHIPFLIFSFSSLLTSKLQLYIPESITFLNCQCNVFWPCVAIIIAAAITKDCSYRNNCGFWFHAGDLEQSHEGKNRSSYDFLLIFMFCYSRFRFRSLRMLIRVCFRHVLQPGIYWFVPGMIWLSANLYNKCTVFTVNLCYVQVLAFHSN